MLEDSRLKIATPGAPPSVPASFSRPGATDHGAGAPTLLASAITQHEAETRDAFGSVAAEYRGPLGNNAVVQQMREFLSDVARGRDGQRLFLIGHSATKFALDHLLTARPLEDAVSAPFDWQPGWEYWLKGK